jgi:YggT family protein
LSAKFAAIGNFYPNQPEISRKRLGDPGIFCRPIAFDGDSPYMSCKERDKSASSRNSAMAIINALLQVLHMALGFYLWIIIASVILSWLTAFGIVNSHQPFVQAVGRFLYAMTEPVMRPIRNRLPTMGGVDLSPLIVIFIIYFLQALIRNILIGTY